MLMMRMKKKERKGKKNRMENNKLPEAQLQHMHDIIMEMFLNSCNVLIKEDLDDHSFHFCISTIQNTLSYIDRKRKEDNYQKLKKL